MTRSLIIVRAGLKSFHESWIDSDSARDWDLYISPYEDLSFCEKPSPGIIIGETIVGPKWTGLRILLNAWSGWKEYDYILLADDDLYAPQSTWNNFFRVCSAFNVKLAQPALTQESSFSHLVTVQNINFMVRWVGFVEIMMPCLRVDVLKDLLPTFNLTQTGWGFGLDLLWPHMLQYQDMMIVDCAPVTHMRPVGVMRNDELSRRNIEELNLIQRRFGAKWMMNTFGGIDQKGDKVKSDDVTFAHRYFMGYLPLLKNNADSVNQIVNAQFRVNQCRA